MYNKDILDELVRQFGEEKTIIFCKMESIKNKLLYEGTEEDRKHHPEPNEWAYERDWWEDHGKKLEKRNKCINYEQ